MKKRDNSERLIKFIANFGKLVNDCKSFRTMISILLEMEDKRILFKVIDTFWVVHNKKMLLFDVLPSKVKLYYRPFFIRNMKTILVNSISSCGRMDCTAKLKDINGNHLFADNSEIAYQFNKSHCSRFMLTVLDTYLKINCK